MPKMTYRGHLCYKIIIDAEGLRKVLKFSDLDV